MEYDNLINDLLKEFPELVAKYEDEKDYIEDLPHLVFTFIFAPFIIGLVRQGGDEHKIVRAFSLIENMLISHDEKVQEVAVVSTLEQLAVEQDIIEKIRKYFGKETEKYFAGLVKYYWGSKTMANSPPSTDGG